MAEVGHYCPYRHGLGKSIMLRSTLLINLLFSEVEGAVQVSPMGSVSWRLTMKRSGGQAHFFLPLALLTHYDFLISSPELHLEVQP